MIPRDAFVRLQPHVPEVMREPAEDRFESDPRGALELLADYFLADEATQAEIRAFFGAIESGESWNLRESGPTSLEIGEAIHGAPDAPLEDVLALCREIKEFVEGGAS